ncbi:MAG: hypothetical protein ACREGL_09010 [Alphaproteobacteria bacterium]
MRFASAMQRRAVFAHLTASRRRAGGFLKRNPGVRQSLRRAAGLGLAVGGLALAAKFTGLRAAARYGALRDLSVSHQMVKAIARPSLGLQALRYELERRGGEAFLLANRTAERARRLGRVAAWTGGLGSVWAATPALESWSDVRGRRRAQRTLIPIQGFVRHGRRIERMKGAAR